LHAISERWRSGLQDLGFRTGLSVTPIVPIIIGEMEPTLFAWKKTFEAGIYTNCFVPPAAPEGQSLLRTSVIATHTDEQIDRALDILADVGKELGLIG
jgi:7-keto-8-aminopelargonate synthetase-like enzyme